MNKAFFFFAFFFSIIGCKEKLTILKVTSTKNSIIVKYSEEKDIVYGIKIPFELEINNRSSDAKDFITIDYEYNPYNKGVGEEVYLGKGVSYKIRNNKIKTVNPLSNKIYLIYSRYRIDRIDSINKFQFELRTYKEKMLAQGKDTLHIGTVKEFKQKHMELFKKLTEGDSISIQFLEGKKLGERVTVPVE